MKISILSNCIEGTNKRKGQFFKNYFKKQNKINFFVEKY